LSSLICVIFQRSKAFRKIFPDYQNTQPFQLSLVSIHRMFSTQDALKSLQDFNASIMCKSSIEFFERKTRHGFSTPPSLAGMSPFAVHHVPKA